MQRLASNQLEYSWKKITDPKPRVADHPIERAFLERWYSRAFSTETLSPRDLLTLFEASRWAPSSYNARPWRFIYALRDDPNWQMYLDLLSGFNQKWARLAGSLVFMASERTITINNEMLASHTHSFDAGAAWAFMTVQATYMGLVTHGMAGVDFERATAELLVPANFRIEAAVAVGDRGDRYTLSKVLQQREVPKFLVTVGQCPIQFLKAYLGVVLLLSEMVMMPDV